MSLIVQRTLEEMVLSHLFPRSEINVFIQVLQADGGEMATALNAATLALIDAGIPLCDFFCSCTAGLINSTPVLGLSSLSSSHNTIDKRSRFVIL